MIRVIALLGLAFLLPALGSLSSGQPAKPADKPKARVDQYGDPLPPGAIARLGKSGASDAVGMHQMVLLGDGKTLVSLSRSPVTGEEKVHVWDLARGKDIRCFRLPDEATTSGVISPDGKTVAFGSDKIIAVWEVESGKEIRRWACDRVVLTAIAYLPDGKTLVVELGHENVADLYFWDVTTGKELRRLGRDGKGFNFVHVSPDGKTMVSLDEQERVHVWDLSAGKELRTFPVKDGTRRLAISPDGGILAEGRFEGMVHCWDLVTGKELRGFRGHRDHVNALAFSPNGKVLATGALDADPTVCLWDVATGKELRKLAGHRSHIYCLAFSPEGKALLSGGEEGTVLIWDVADLTK